MAGPAKMPLERFSRQPRHLPLRVQATAPPTSLVRCALTPTRLSGVVHPYSQCSLCGRLSVQLVAMHVGTYLRSKRRGGNMLVEHGVCSLVEALFEPAQLTIRNFLHDMYLPGFLPFRSGSPSARRTRTQRCQLVLVAPAFDVQLISSSSTTRWNRRGFSVSSDTVGRSGQMRQPVLQLLVHCRNNVDPQQEHRYRLRTCRAFSASGVALLLNA